MPPSSDPLDTLIHDVLTTPAPAPVPVGRAYPVIRFAVGTGVFTLDACLMYVLWWLLAHG